MKRIFINLIASIHFFLLRQGTTRAASILFCLILVVGYDNNAASLEIPDAHYPNLLKTGVDVTKFVPDGWEIEMQAKGDLNKDGIEDVVLVLRENNPENVIKNDDPGEQLFNTNPRILAVLFGKKDGGYNLIENNHTLIPRRTDPVILDYLTGVGDGGVSIQQGTLTVKMGIFSSAGSWGMSSISYTFRWQNNKFELIGYDSTTTNRASAEIKSININYSTRKVKIVCGNFTSDSDGKVSWQKLSSNKIWTIDSIGDGLEFDPGVNMNCNE